MELAQKEAAKSLQVSRKLSAPTLTISSSLDDPKRQQTTTPGSVVSGYGLGLVGVALEQDVAYWEWHISLPPREHVDTTMFGVCSKKDRTFYQELQAQEPQEEGTYDFFGVCVAFPLG